MLKRIGQLNAIGWGLTAEIVAELVRARLLTLFSPHRYLPPVRLETVAAEGDARQVSEAAKIGRLVERFAAWMPFRAVCLQQAVATSRMLLRRRVPAVLCLGVSSDPNHRLVPSEGRAAHAWVCVGDRVVCGGTALQHYAVVGRFGIA